MNGVRSCSKLSKLNIHTCVSITAIYIHLFYIYHFVYVDSLSISTATSVINIPDSCFELIIDMNGCGETLQLN